MPEPGEVRARVSLDSVAVDIDAVKPPEATASDATPTGGNGVVGESFGDGTPADAGGSRHGRINEPPECTPADRHSSPSGCSTATPDGGSAAVLSIETPVKSLSKAFSAAWAIGQTGWVTLVKDGRKLVTSRVKLGPDSRRQVRRCINGIPWPWPCPFPCSCPCPCPCLACARNERCASTHVRRSLHASTVCEAMGASTTQ